MKEIIFLVVGFFSLILMVKRNGCPDLFSEKGGKLWEYIRQLCFEMGENNFSSEFLEEKSGVSADIFKNIFSGRTEIRACLINRSDLYHFNKIAIEAT